MIETPETPSQDPLRPIAIEDVVSGEFDQESEDSISPILTKRVLPPQAEDLTNLAQEMPDSAKGQHHD
jgi:hypothetical protein